MNDRKIGPTVLSVRSFAALGDGVHDDTLAFQCAIDALPSEGGTVTVPEGLYLIDPTISVFPRSHTRLHLLPGAVLVAKPCDDPRSNVIWIKDVEEVMLSGGQIMGEREQHEYVEGSTHEWGHGVRVGNSRGVTISDISVSHCAGDGLSLSGEDVVLRRVISTHNRRQGLTLAKGSGYRILESTFSHTGWEVAGINGTAPKAGIDIEPDDPTTCTDVLIQGCQLLDNAGCGVLMYTTRKGAEVPRNSNIRVIDCTIERNSNGVEVTHSHDVVIAGCQILGQRFSGVNVSFGAQVAELSGNTFSGNYTRGTTVVPPRDPPFDQVGTSKKTERDVLVRPAGSANVGTNRYE